jgi:hypothetical protein
MAIARSFQRRSNLSDFADFTSNLADEGSPSVGSLLRAAVEGRPSIIKTENFY